MFRIKLSDATLIEINESDIIKYVFVMLICTIVFFIIDAKMLVLILFLVFTLIFIKLSMKDVDEVE